MRRLLPPLHCPLSGAAQTGGLPLAIVFGRGQLSKLLRPAAAAAGFGVKEGCGIFSADCRGVKLADGRAAHKAAAGLADGSYAGQVAGGAGAVIKWRKGRSACGREIAILAGRAGRGKVN